MEISYVFLPWLYSCLWYMQQTTISKTPLKSEFESCPWKGVRKLDNDSFLLQDKSLSSGVL